MYIVALTLISVLQPPHNVHFHILQLHVIRRVILDAALSAAQRERAGTPTASNKFEEVLYISWYCLEQNIYHRTSPGGSYGFLLTESLTVFT